MSQCQNGTFWQSANLKRTAYSDLAKIQEILSQPKGNKSDDDTMMKGVVWSDVDVLELNDILKNRPIIGDEVLVHSLTDRRNFF